MLSKLVQDLDLDCTLHLFDTFEGMPETNPELDLHQAGDFEGTSLEDVKNRIVSALGKNDERVQFHQGFIPDTFKDLEKLPGVGHKTASVVMSQAFGFPAFPVDTHIHRLAGRWGLSRGKTVERTERDLKQIFPEMKWNKLHLQIIYFGREYCPARGHDLTQCQICKWAATQKRIAEESYSGSKK